MRDWRGLVIHHTVTPETATKKEIYRIHVVERGWSDIGYHFIVRRRDDDKWVVEPCRSLSMVGAHALVDNPDAAGSFNSTHIGLAICGNYSLEAPSDAALEAAAQQAAKLYSAFNMRGAHQVVGHSELPGAATECPGKLFDMGAFRSQVLAHLLAAPMAVLGAGDGSEEV
uniref:Putative N-acetylmuramoyl-L-alanine amidase n=1 Tax=viral metagenome TaxID=1070528 RepID=A0A6H1ZIB7_9ZZZZ